MQPGRPCCEQRHDVGIYTRGARNVLDQRSRVPPSSFEIHVTAPAYDAAITGDSATAKLAVFKDSRSSDITNVAEWTWGGWTRQQLQDAAGS